MTANHVEHGIATLSRITGIHPPSKLPHGAYFGRSKATVIFGLPPHELVIVFQNNPESVTSIRGMAAQIP
jgi:hypothetical protein